MEKRYEMKQEFKENEKGCTTMVYLFDNETNTILDCDKIDLLNQQDAKIKELEKAMSRTIEIIYDKNDLQKENQQLKERCNLLQEAITMQSNTIEEYIKTENERLKPLNHQLAVKDKALELAIADKCKAENMIAESIVGKGAKVSVPKKEQWYLEQAEKELKE